MPVQVILQRLPLPGFSPVQAAIPFLEKSQCASIVLISSVSGFEVDFAAGSYGAVKAALWARGKKAGLYSMRDVLGLGAS